MTSTVVSDRLGAGSKPVPTPEPKTFQQLRLLCSDPIQHDYEVIRTVILFGERVTQRGGEIGGGFSIRNAGLTGCMTQRYGFH